MKATNLNSVKDLHKTSDENLEFVMGTLGYDPQYMLHDTKLALGYATVALAAGLFYVDKYLKIPFTQVKGLTTAIVAVYGVLSAILFLINQRYKNVNYVGFNPKTQSKILVATWSKDPEPVYNVKIIHAHEEKILKIPFSKFFDYTGILNNSALVELLREGVETKKEQ